MRVDYMSDLHLESQGFDWPLQQGDVLILAGDICHARIYAAESGDLYAQQQRERVNAFIGRALANYTHVLMVAGNHDHYEGQIEQTAGLFRANLPGVTVLDNEAVQIDGVTFYGSTLWADFEGGNADALRVCGKGCGEFFFVKMQDQDGVLRRFRPADALALHRRDVAALRAFLETADRQRTVIITHHAPSRKSLNPLNMGNGKDGAYASDLDDLVTGTGVPFWVHGHTHVIRRYRLSETLVLANCRGFDGRDPATRDFSPRASFEI